MGRLRRTRGGSNQGLTQTYNRLKDPDCHVAEIVELRRLHHELDEKVLAAYGWHDVATSVPPYGTPTTENETRALSAYEDVIIDRLFALNTERAAAEAAAAPAPAAKPKRKPKAPPATPQLELAPADPAPRRSRKKPVSPSE